MNRLTIDGVLNSYYTGGRDRTVDLQIHNLAL
jgi:hypothetical protein